MGDSEFEEQLRKRLQEAGESVQPKRRSRRYKRKDTDIPRRYDPESPTAGKTLSVSFPHLGWRPVIELICAHYQISVTRWILQLIKAGIHAAILESPALSELIRQTSQSLWEEAQEGKMYEPRREDAFSDSA